MLKIRDLGRRLIIIISLDCVNMLSGTVFSNAGITDLNTQLLISIYLSLFTFLVAKCGALIADRMGRKLLDSVSETATTGFTFLLGGLMGFYRTSKDRLGMYGTVASMFLFSSAYAFGVTLIDTLYVPKSS